MYECLAFGKTCLIICQSDDHRRILTNYKKLKFMNIINHSNQLNELNFKKFSKY